MYKTIVVYVDVDGGAAQAGRMRAAALLADGFGAHVVGVAATGISWFDFALLTGSAVAPVPADDFTSMREAAAERLRGFDAEAARLGIASHETRLVEDVADYGLLLQSRYADLLVLGMESPDAAAGTGLVARGRMRGLPERVCLRGTRPVLLTPTAWRGDRLDGTALVGWDGGACALRAIAAALPLLQRAASVKLALINPERMSELHGELHAEHPGEQPGADMARYLARHGLQVDILVERTKSTAGNALIGMARASGAGLMVTGAYGHNRLREWVLGGVTRELFERAPVPLLVAH